jgi:integrase
VEEDEDEVKVLSRVQLAALLTRAPERNRLLFELIAGSGLRVSETIAPQRRHLVLDGDEPLVRVRRAIVKRRVEPPKSKHGRRDVRISKALPQSSERCSTRGRARRRRWCSRHRTARRSIPTTSASGR